MKIQDALHEVGTVEGYYAAEMAHELSLKYNVELPIVNEVYSILYENKDVNSVVSDLMNRPNKAEH